VEYDYLVLALGTAPDFLQIEGAKDYALALCSLPDALRIRNAVEFLVQSHRIDWRKPEINLIIVGGGPAGVELAGELVGLADRVAWKYGFPREKILIKVLESSGRLLPWLGELPAKDAYLRLRELGVQSEFNKAICRVERNFVEFADTERIHFDLLVWNAGEKGKDIIFESEVVRNKQCKLQTNADLSLVKDSGIFALGDLGAIVNQQGEEVCGGGVEWALSQAKYLAGIFPEILRNRRPRPFAFESSGSIITIGGKWAMASLRKIYFTGYAAYLLGQWVRLNYYRKIIGWRKAIKYWWLNQQLYGRNN
jgi:NADH dehydrogenase